MGIGKEKSTDELGEGKGQGADRPLPKMAHGFYEPAKIQQTWSAKNSQGDTSSRAPRVRRVIPSVTKQFSSLAGEGGVQRQTWPELPCSGQWTDRKKACFPSCGSTDKRSTSQSLLVDLF